MRVHPVAFRTREDRVNVPEGFRAPSHHQRCGEPALSASGGRNDPVQPPHGLHAPQEGPGFVAGNASPDRLGPMSSPDHSRTEADMTTAATNREQVITEAIREISHIATLPEITLKIVELVEDPRSTAQDLHKIISNDPALCSRILKVVNSSFYGLPGQIGSINRAIVMLGLNAVKNIAIAASLAKLFRGGELTPNFSAKSLWMHSVATAASAKMLSDRMGFAASDEAFLCGLIHDIGIMVEMQFDRAKLIDVVQKVGPDDQGVPALNMCEVEEAVFNANHQHFGAALCAKWKFPAAFATVTGHHHDPLELPPDARMLPSIVYVADRLAAEVGGGFRLDLPSTEVGSDVRDWLKLTTQTLDELRRDLPEHLKSVESMLA